MDFLFGFIFEFLIEVSLQLVAELFVEGGVRALKRKFKSVNPIVAVISYSLAAFALGYLSTSIWPKLMLEGHKEQLLGLLLSPIVLGLIMGFRGKLLLKKGKVAMRIDSFAYGFLFALIFAVTRYLLLGGT